MIVNFKGEAESLGFSVAAGAPAEPGQVSGEFLPGPPLGPPRGPRRAPAGRRQRQPLDLVGGRR